MKKVNKQLQKMTVNCKVVYTTHMTPKAPIGQPSAWRVTITNPLQPPGSK
jgi:hypothetical protein